MFVRSLRLRKSSDIARVYKRGSRVFSDHLRLYYLANPRRDLRVTVVASKNIDKRATRRNTAKRRVRELVREEIKSLACARFDIIVTVQPSLDEVSVSQLRLEVGQLFRKLRADCIKLAKK